MLHCRLTDPLQADAPERATQRAVDVSLVAERALDVMATGAGSIADPHASSDVREIYAREKDHVLSFLFGDAVHIDQSGEIRQPSVPLPCLRLRHAYSLAMCVFAAVTAADLYQSCSACDAKLKARVPDVLEAAVFVQQQQARSLLSHAHAVVAFLKLSLSPFSTMLLMSRQHLDSCLCIHADMQRLRTAW